MSRAGLSRALPRILWRPEKPQSMLAKRPGLTSCPCPHRAQLCPHGRDPGQSPEPAPGTEADFCTGASLQATSRRPVLMLASVTAPGPDPLPGLYHPGTKQPWEAARIVPSLQMRRREDEGFPKITAKEAGEAAGLVRRHTCAYTQARVCMFALPTCTHVCICVHVYTYLLRFYMRGPEMASS